MTPAHKEREILKSLGRRVAEIAALPIQAERRALQARIERLERTRPLVLIYQEPWNELEAGGALDLLCEDPLCRGLEIGLRRTLYKWEHYQDDAPIAGEIVQYPCVRDTGFGIEEDVEIARTDPTSAIVSRHFHIQIRDEADAAKIRFPEVRHDAARTEEEFQRKAEIFDGVLPVVRRGIEGFWFAPWDELVRWTGVEEILADMADRPAYVHRLIGRLVDAWLHRLDQYEALHLLARPCVDLWGHGAAQIFSAVSPAMHEEFALRHEARWYVRFGRVYYGCCEPLHHKVDVVRRALPNLRRISMSPWVDFEQAVRNVGRDLIFAWKPNPALLAGPTWQPEAVRRDLRDKLNLARVGGCVVEIHLKDISTVGHDPRRLWEWARIARETAAEFG